MERDDFGNGFKWGVSTAAYQIEGGHNVDGKGPSIWDLFTDTKGKIFKNQNASRSCNFYEQYVTDLALISKLHIPHFRFSLSWSRIMPSGHKYVNPHGIDFYNRVIDLCLELGIEPWITLYHWDLPLELEKAGGWTNRQIIDWFRDYVAVCIGAFGDRVTNWMVLNEPMVFTGAGYFLGVHAPGRKGLGHFLPAVHHAALCQAEGGRTIRSLGTHFNIGTTFSCSHIDALTETRKDREAAVRADALLNRLFVEPLLGKGYPVGDLGILNRLEPYIKAEDEQNLAFAMDFIGIQNYTREMVAHSCFMPFLKAKIIRADKRGVERTVMNWEVYPESLYHVLHKFGNYDNVPELIVTENGAAFEDIPIDGKVHDEKRISYLKDYIFQVLRAKREGIPVTGYFIWSLMDNFEWAEGYHPRFGIVYVDFDTGQRIVKSSGYWYRLFLQGVGSPILDVRAAGLTD